MLPEVGQDVHVVEVAVDGVQVLWDRKAMKSTGVNNTANIQREVCGDSRSPRSLAISRRD